MHNTFFTIVPIIINTQTLERFLISSKDTHYEPISINSNECGVNDDIDTCLSKLMNKYITNINTRILQYRILSISKNETKISINYGVVVPHTVKTTNAYIKNYNIGILHPLVRKALAYA